MNPATLLLVVQGIQAVIAAAPQVAQIIGAAKNWAAALFSAGLITKEQQDAIHARIDADAALWAAGIPLHWTVEPDPA